MKHLTILAFAMAVASPAMAFLPRPVITVERVAYQAAPGHYTSGLLICDQATGACTMDTAAPSRVIFDADRAVAYVQGQHPGREVQAIMASRGAGPAYDALGNLLAEGEGASF